MAGIIDGLLFTVAISLIEKIGFVGLNPLLIDIGSWLFMVAYIILMTHRFGGTLGKLAMDLRVYELSESRYLSLSKSALRESPWIAINALIYSLMIYNYVMPDNKENHWLDIAINVTTLSWFALEILSALFNNKRRAIHDYIAGSVVVWHVSSRKIA